MKKAAIITSTRAEYGLLVPLIQKVEADLELELSLIVTGGHLSEKQGYTIDEIRKDGFPIAHEIPILEEGNTPYEISLTIANAVRGFADCFCKDRPDIAVILGDRTEMLGAASAAMIEKIPIAHIHGGEITKGAVDDCVRHALTKMSYLHFTSTEIYRKRVIQLGEEPKRVFCVGALGAENVMRTPLIDEKDIRRDIGISQTSPYIVVTFHPATLDDVSAEQQADELCRAMEKKSRFFFLITKANADAGGDAVNRLFYEFTRKHVNTKLVSSLGRIRYLSAVKYAVCVLGNSSSGILEAPVIGTPSVNIGDRQTGRIMADSVICCEPQTEQIVRALDKAEKMEHRRQNLYGDGKTSDRIVKIIREYLIGEKINLKKEFYDIYKTL